MTYHNHPINIPVELINIGEQMPVQKSRVSRAKRGMRRSHHALSAPTLSVDVTSAETHYRHNITKGGYYRGRQIVVPKTKTKKSTEDEQQP